MPSDAAGPVADSVTPIFSCADAAVALPSSPAAQAIAIHRFIFIACLQTLRETRIDRSGPGPALTST
jgi:hypothetical protein